MGALLKWAWWEKTEGGNPNWPDPAPQPPTQTTSPEVDADETEEGTDVPE